MAPKLVAVTAVMLMGQLALWGIRSELKPASASLNGVNLQDWPMQLDSWQGSTTAMAAEVVRHSDAKEMGTWMYQNPIGEQVLAHVAPESREAVVEVVLHAFPAGFGDDRGGGRIGGRDEPQLGGLLVADMDEDVAAVGGDAHAQEHALVGLLIDQDVLAAAGRAAVDLGGAGVLVAPDPEQPLAVGREGERAIGAVDRVIERLRDRQDPIS